MSVPIDPYGRGAASREKATVAFVKGPWHGKTGLIPVDMLDNRAGIPAALKVENTKGKVVGEYRQAEGLNRAGGSTVMRFYPNRMPPGQEKR